MAFETLEEINQNQKKFQDFWDSYTQEEQAKDNALIEPYKNVLGDVSMLGNLFSFGGDIRDFDEVKKTFLENFKGVEPDEAKRSQLMDALVRHFHNSENVRDAITQTNAWNAEDIKNNLTASGYYNNTPASAPNSVSKIGENSLPSAGIATGLANDGVTNATERNTQQLLKTPETTSIDKLLSAPLANPFDHVGALSEELAQKQREVKELQAKLQTEYRTQSQALINGMGEHFAKIKESQNLDDGHILTRDDSTRLLEDLRLLRSKQEAAKNNGLEFPSHEKASMDNLAAIEPSLKAMQQFYDKLDDLQKGHAKDLARLEAVYKEAEKQTNLTKSDPTKETANYIERVIDSSSLTEQEKLAQSQKLLDLMKNPGVTDASLIKNFFEGNYALAAYAPQSVQGGVNRPSGTEIDLTLSSGPNGSVVASWKDEPTAEKIAERERQYQTKLDEWRQNPVGKFPEKPSFEGAVTHSITIPAGGALSLADLPPDTKVNIFAKENTPKISIFTGNLNADQVNFEHSDVAQYKQYGSESRKNHGARKVMDKIVETNTDLAAPGEVIRLVTNDEKIEAKLTTATERDVLAEMVGDKLAQNKRDAKDSVAKGILGEIDWNAVKGQAASMQSDDNVSQNRSSLGGLQPCTIAHAAPKSQGTSLSTSG